MAATNNYKVKLVLSIIEEHFGSITKDVAYAVITTEVSTIFNIAKKCSELPKELKINSKQVKEALLVLQQHNCLTIELPPEVDVEGDTALIATEKLKQSGLIYSLSLDMVINRLRFAKILTIANKLFGSVAVAVIEELAVHGRLKVAQISADTTEKLFNSAMSTLETSDDDFIGSAEDRRKIQNDVLKTFELMVQRRLIVSVAPLDLKKRLTERIEKNKLTLGRVANASGIATGTASAGPVSAKVQLKRKRKDILAADNPDAKSHSLPLELRMMMADTENGNSSNSVNSNAPSEAVWQHRLNEESASHRESEDIKRASKMSRTAAGGRGRGRGRGGRGAVRVDAEMKDTENNENEINGNGNGGKSDGVEDWMETGEEEDERKIKESLALMNGQSGGDLGSREDVLWTVGWEQLVRERRHELCIGLASDRMEVIAGAVVRIMLAASMNSEIGDVQKHSLAVSIVHIHDNLRTPTAVIKADAKQSSGSSGSASSVSGSSTSVSTDNKKKEDKGVNGYFDIGLPTLRKLLDLLRLDAVGIVSKVPGSEGAANGPLYTVNMDGIIRTLRHRTLHSIAVDRFGNLSARVIELLQRKKFLEQQNIADLAIIPAREARERLYKLFKEGWVDYYELSKRTDFNPSTTTFFWFLDKKNLEKSILEHSYKAIFNLRCRRFHEYQLGKPILDYKITDPIEAAQFDKLAALLNRLDLGVLKVDETLILLEKF